MPKLTVSQTKTMELLRQKDWPNLPYCITQHPGFHVICLNRWVLWTAWYQCKKDVSDRFQDISAQNSFSSDWMIYKENYHDGSFVFLSRITE